MKKNIIFSLFFFFLFSVFAQNPLLAGNQTSIQEKDNPYYQRLLQAGFFENKKMPIQDEPSVQDIQSLFRTARSFRYTKDNLADHWQSADETSKKHQGDCEDMALWLYAQMVKQGFENVRLVIGKYRPWDKSSHVWILLESGQDTYIVDPVIQKKPWSINSFPRELYKPLHFFHHSGV